MTLIKFNKRDRLLPRNRLISRNRFFPWNNSLKDFLSSDEFFKDDFFSEDSFMPAMNVKEHQNDFEIEFAAPGFSKKDFEVTIKDDVLNVCGEKRREEEEIEEDYTRKEFSYNSFKRSLKLPSTVNPDAKVKATYKNGILKLNLLKKEDIKQTPKKVIEVV
ncbi:MAG: Hsp20/alpha crystallin family protein [Flavobacteriaceae bacterium]|nr:Hsp20/alpha crystallin family protein [Flavobacteriaceae bacterium]